MNKSTIGLILSAGVIVYGLFQTAKEMKQMAGKLESELNRILKENYEWSHDCRVIVVSKSRLSTEVEITLLQGDSVIATTETKYCRYLGWFGASTWLARRMTEIGQSAKA